MRGKAVYCRSGQVHFIYAAAVAGKRRAVPVRIYILKIGYDRYMAKYLIEELKDYGFQTGPVA